MLQLNTGFLFQYGTGIERNVRSVLYSNIGTIPMEIKTMAGDLYLMANQEFPCVLAYDFVERIEKSVPQKKVNQITGDILEEFSVLATFGLPAIFSPEQEMVRILTDKQVQSYREQDILVRRIFDRHIILDETEIHDFTKLVEDFLTLESDSYDKAKKSINRYAIAIRNIPINPTTAYTMLVSAIDVLIPQDYTIQTTIQQNEIEPSQQNDEKPRKSPSRGNFIKYLEDHIDLEDLASELLMSDFPIKKEVLNILSNNAYFIRSKFIHGTKQLPRELSIPSNFAEYKAVDDDFYLTLQGLVRITKQLITNFIKKGRKIDIEKLKALQQDQSKIDQDVIILTPDSLNPEKSNYRLQFNSMLELYRNYLLGLEDTFDVDKRPQLYEIERTIDAATDNDKVTMFAIHTFYNAIVEEEDRSKGHEEFFNKFEYLMAKYYPEILIIRTITGNHDWSLATHQDALDEYRRIRFEKERIVGGPMFESAFYLDFAERHRKENKSDDEKTKDKVEKLIRRAVREFPNHLRLRQFAKEYDGVKPIDWMEILVVKDNEGEA